MEFFIRFRCVKMNFLESHYGLLVHYCNKSHRKALIHFIGFVILSPKP